MNNKNYKREFNLFMEELKKDEKITKMIDKCSNLIDKVQSIGDEQSIKPNFLDEIFIEEIKTIDPVLIPIFLEWTSFKNKTINWSNDYTKENIVYIDYCTFNVDIDNYIEMELIFKKDLAQKIKKHYDVFNDTIQIAVGFDYVKREWFVMDDCGYGSTNIYDIDTVKKMYEYEQNKIMIKKQIKDKEMLAKKIQQQEEKQRLKEQKLIEKQKRNEEIKIQKELKHQEKLAKGQLKKDNKSKEKFSKILDKMQLKLNI